MKLFKLLAVTAFVLLAGSMVSCKKSSEDSAAKTLNKSTLTSKAWYNQGGSIIHDFRGNNVYSNTGTWRWVNNSDTLEIVPSAGGFKTYWKMNWNTDHEMNCRKVGSADELYKDQFWQ
jgi:hypothetical protein